VTSVAVGQANGRTIILSGSADRTVRMWDAATSSSVGAPLTGHTGVVSSVAVGQVDGRAIIVSGSGDRTVRMWDTASGNQVGAPLTGHTDWVTTVTVRQVDGRTIIASGSDDQILRIWHITFRNGHLGELASYRDRPINTHALSGDNVDRSISDAMGSGNGAFSLPHNEPRAQISLRWSLPYKIKAISHLADDSWVVAFGDEIGTFRETT
jgi:WD40 repeat protein